MFKKLIVAGFLPLAVAVLVHGAAAADSAPTVADPHPVRHSSSTTSTGWTRSGCTVASPVGQTATDSCVVASQVEALSTSSAASTPRTPVTGAAPATAIPAGLGLLVAGWALLLTAASRRKLAQKA